MTPASGVFLPFEAKRSGSTVHVGVGIEEHDVGGGADVERADAGDDAVEAEGADGADRQALDQGLEGDAAIVDEAHAEAERCLEAADAEGGVVELAELFDDGVRGVVGGDAVDGAVGEACDAGVDVVLRAEGRVHLGVGVVDAGRSSRRARRRRRVRR